MHDSEKLLIKDLFNRLLESESKLPNKDRRAEELIYSMLRKQNNSPYYMVQTILIQDVIIKELNNKITTLKKKMNSIRENDSTFLSNYLKSSILSKNQESNKASNKFNVAPNMNETNKPVSNRNRNTSQREIISSTSNRGGISSFFSSALQTAAGVAGGMVAGNILTDFLHSKMHNNEIVDHSDSDNNITSTDHENHKHHEHHENHENHENHKNHEEREDNQDHQDHHNHQGHQVHEGNRDHTDHESHEENEDHHDHEDSVNNMENHTNNLDSQDNQTSYQNDLDNTTEYFDYEDHSIEHSDDFDNTYF
ncbi:Putative uncharacterized protein Yba2 [Buchnera aphidicola (Pterocallis alni)]|uniref:DUF2076 domain-containing protein n=1 Tax=Buchnera aphidicola TaxID=9 RepID=UPI00346481D4